MPLPVNGRLAVRTSRETVLYGQTPAAICRQQLELMAKALGMSSTDFARRVASGRTEDNLALLQQYHVTLRPHLACFFDDLRDGLGGCEGEGASGEGERVRDTHTSNVTSLSSHSKRKYTRGKRSRCVVQCDGNGSSSSNIGGPDCSGRKGGSGSRCDNSNGGSSGRSVRDITSMPGPSCSHSSSSKPSSSSRNSSHSGIIRSSYSSSSKSNCNTEDTNIFALRSHRNSRRDRNSHNSSSSSNSSSRNNHNSCSSSRSYSRNNHNCNSSRKGKGGLGKSTTCNRNRSGGRRSNVIETDDRIQWSKEDRIVIVVNDSDDSDSDGVSIVSSSPFPRPPKSSGVHGADVRALSCSSSSEGGTGGGNGSSSNGRESLGGNDSFSKGQNNSSVCGGGADSSSNSGGSGGSSSSSSSSSSRSQKLDGSDRHSKGHNSSSSSASSSRTNTYNMTDDNTFLAGLLFDDATEINSSGRKSQNKNQRKGKGNRLSDGNTGRETSNQGNSITRGKVTGELANRRPKTTIEGDAEKGKTIITTTTGDKGREREGSDNYNVVLDSLLFG